MTLYNPFKPHIVKYNNGYAIRKLDVFIWTYLDNKEKYWWYSNEYICEYCVFKSIELVRLRMIEYRFKIKTPSKFVEQ
jgi:hypothetical protein